MRQDYRAPDESLSALLSADFARVLLADPLLSRDFFDLLTPYDHLPVVLKTLERIHSDNATVFRDYQELALAIALVFDVPPPPQWPHGQVSARQLPRELGDPL